MVSEFTCLTLNNNDKCLSFLKNNVIQYTLVYTSHRQVSIILQWTQNRHGEAKVKPY